MPPIKDKKEIQSNYDPTESRIKSTKEKTLHLRSNIESMTCSKQPWGELFGIFIFDTVCRPLRLHKREDWYKREQTSPSVTLYSKTLLLENNQTTP